MQITRGRSDGIVSTSAWHAVSGPAGFCPGSRSKRAHGFIFLGQIGQKSSLASVALSELAAEEYLEALFEGVGRQ